MGKKSPIYSRIGYEEAIGTKRNILEMQADLLKVIKNIEEYKDLRKKELIWKIKLKSLLKEVNDGIKYIESKVPEADELKEFNKNDKIEKKISIEEGKEFQKSKEAKIKKQSSIEIELEEIKRKLEEMSWKNNRK